METEEVLLKCDFWWEGKLAFRFGRLSELFDLAWTSEGLSGVTKDSKFVVKFGSKRISIIPLPPVSPDNLSVVKQMVDIGVETINILVEQNEIKSTDMVINYKIKFKEGNEYTKLSAYTKDFVRDLKKSTQLDYFGNVFDISAMLTIGEKDFIVTDIVFDNSTDSVVKIEGSYELPAETEKLHIVAEKLDEFVENISVFLDERGAKHEKKNKGNQAKV